MCETLPTLTAQEFVRVHLAVNRIYVYAPYDRTRTKRHIPEKSVNPQPDIRHLSSITLPHKEGQDMMVVYRIGFLIYKDKAGTYVIRARCDHPDLYQP